VATAKKRTTSKAPSKRGRPAGVLPDRAWAEEQKKGLQLLIQAADRDVKKRRDPKSKRAAERFASYVRGRLAQFEAGLPKRYRAGQPAQIYLNLKDSHGSLPALDGPFRDRTQQVFRGAVEAVKTFLLVRRIAEDSPIRGLGAPAKAKATHEFADRMPVLRESADRACGGAWAHWKGRPTTKKAGLFARALKFLDEGGEDWPQELRVTDKGRAILVVSKASGASIHAIKNMLRRK
jgi:hypothetical protein